jgi:catechol 2,3-dioxygenase-like lactoylglutathione lyase family enzyme
VIVERTDFISVPVTDMERATSFYRDTLGLEHVPRRRVPPEVRAT